eukprot:7208292-Alexandrium_andersonii.AAC.1
MCDRREVGQLLEDRPPFAVRRPPAPFARSARQPGLGPTLVRCEPDGLVGGPAVDLVAVPDVHGEFGGQCVNGGPAAAFSAGQPPPDLPPRRSGQ